MANRCRKLLLAALLASLEVVSWPLLAQTPATRFEHLSVEEGLSHSSVNAIEQDLEGFLWFGTRNGLNRYDGYRFRVFQHDPDDPGSLSQNNAFRLLVDRQGELWVVTQSGLDRFDQTEERFIYYRHDPEDPRSISSNMVGMILEDHSGHLWAGTMEGLNRLEPDGTFVRYLHDPGDEGSLSDPRAGVLFEDRKGQLWVGTYGGLDLLDRRSGTFRHFRHDPTDPGSLSDSLINAIQEDPDGALWVGTARGLNRFDPETETFVRYRHGSIDLTTERIWQLFVDSRGDLWVGTLNDGLIRIPRDGGFPTQYRHDDADPWSLNGDRVQSIFEDSSGILWAGTYVGLNKYDRRREQFAIYRREPGRDQTLTDSNISAILEDHSGALWVGTWDKGLNRVDRERGTVAHYQPDARDPRSLPDDTVQALCEDLSGALWVATWGGLARLDPAGKSFDVYRPVPGDSTSLDSDAVMSVYQDGREQIWVGTIVGLSRFEPTSDSFVRYRLGEDLDPGAGPILEDRAGTLWVGSIPGLFYLEADAAAAGSRDLEKLRHHPDDDSADGHPINALYEDLSGNLWIATEGAGLSRLDPARASSSHYREADGLASNQVLGILEDDSGHLWLSTSRGLSRLDPGTGIFRNFGVEDGLQANVFSHHSAFRSSRGEMFFGGTHGFNAFFPDQIREDLFVPPVVLTDFQLFNESVPTRRVDADSPLDRPLLEATEIRLSHRHDVFSLEFAALHYASPRKSRYAYRLEGFDDDWITTSADRRLATYTNLDAGTYRFKVRGGSPSGVWNEEEATIRIVVAPPPWETWWAYTLYTLAVAAVILGAVRSQRRKLEQERAARQNELEQEQAISRRLREVDRLKDEFLANTSHELRTPLYGIIGLAESLIDGGAGELPEIARTNLALVVNSGRRLATLVNDILDFSKLKHHSLELDLKPVDLHTMVDVVLTLSRPLVGSKPLRLENGVRANLQAVLADENRLQQILHNLVGNAVKFTEEGEVEISASESRRAEGREEGSERMNICVRDTGIGIPEDQQERIFQAFAQADASTEREFGGTGLGLAVSHQLIALHGGELGVSSTPGRGSTFHFDLEISAEPAPSAAVPPRISLATVDTPRDPATPDPLTREAEAAKATGASLLVVDDEPVIRQVVTQQLTAHGFRVTPAASGAGSLRLVEERSFDLVILDVMMPQMSGYEVCRRLRERYSLEELPVIFLTAKNQAEDLVVGLSAGANDYLPKPVSKSELLARVRTHIALLQVNRQLSGLVSERTSQLAEREFLLGERERLIGELEARNAELARFNYTVAHDLQNPMTTIRTFIGQLEKHVGEGDLEALSVDLPRIGDAAGNLHRLLDELYEYSRIDRVAMLREEVALDDLVRQALDDLAGPITERGVEIEVSTDLPVVHGDPARLLEALRHLLNNAVTHLGDQPSPRIEVGSRDAAPLEVEAPTLYVRDNGIGIDPAYHDRIFELFERLDPRASKGTGIGLVLVKRIVEAHGGRIWVESEGMGRGSTFCFTLPA